MYDDAVLMAEMITDEKSHIRSIPCRCYCKNQENH